MSTPGLPLSLSKELELQNDVDLNLRRYPAIKILIRWGSLVAVALSAAPLVAAVVCVTAGATWWWLVAAAVASPMLYLFLCSYLELIRIIDDTLLPR